MCELATVRENICDLPDTNIIFVAADRFRDLNSTVKNRSLLRRRQNTFENPTMHEQVTVQEISQAPLHCCVFSRIPIEFGLVFLLVSQSVLDLTVDFGPCVARACCTHVQPSPSGTHRCDSTASSGLVNPQISITDVEACAPQVVGSFPPFEEFVAPMCNKSLRQYGCMFYFKKFKWSRFWSGYRNKLLNPSMCWHLQ